MRKLWFLTLCCFLWGCGKSVEATAPTIAEPDRDLYEQAMKQLNKSRWDTGRLLLQTLITTYQESEYLPQAMYALAESFYREGTTSALTQADAKFRDYILFYPDTDLTDDAQHMIAMTHFRQMEKPDRDPTQARLAEVEFKKMIEEYPDSDLLDPSKEKLRETQEVLAEGVYRIAKHYSLRKAWPAATSRFKEVMENYPDFSKMDDTVYLLAESLRESNREEEAAVYYAQVVRDFPMSERSQTAKERLAALNMPVPDPNPVALARSQDRDEGKSMLARVFAMFKSRPDVSTDTNAHSVLDAEKAAAAAAAQEGGGRNDGDGRGEFSIEPVVQGPPQQANRPN